MKKKRLLAAYFELSKPRILTLVLVTTTLGYYLGAKRVFTFSLFLKLLTGVGLTCAGSSALNHYLEREYDSKMQRTQNRPIPAGIIQPAHALAFGVVLVLAGIALLLTQINLFVSFLTLLTSFLYIMVYTPMKRVTWFSTTVGAIPGAMPPLLGWAGAGGSLHLNAFALFLILFIWQHPHFYAITWMFKEDYKRAGFKMLPCLEPNGERDTLSQIRWFASGLIPISLIPAMTGLLGPLYLVGALMAGGGVWIVAHTFIRSRSHTDARALLKATILYLPVLFTFVVLDSILKFQ